MRDPWQSRLSCARGVRRCWLPWSSVFASPPLRTSLFVPAVTPALCRNCPTRYVRAVRSKRAGWLLPAAGVLMLGLAGYVVVVLRVCGELSDIGRGSFRFRVCGVGGEPIAAVPVINPRGAATYSRRQADGMKPSVSTLKYGSARPADEVRTALAAFLTGRDFTLARREPDFEWWTDHRSEIGIAARAAGDRQCDVEVIHNTGSD